MRYIGDGTLCTFESAIKAVSAAIEIQRTLLDNEINLRIGIHVGDVVIEGDEVYGDGVNVASRLEPLAPTGGICVSETVYDNIKNQAGIECVSIGQKNLKNVKRPMEVYALVGEGLASPSSASNKINMKWIGVAVLTTALVIIGLKFDFGTLKIESKEDLNSLRIAVLPFDNMSSDPENEFFADGITDDILAQLAKINEAIKLLEKAIDGGWSYREWLENDSDLDPLRDHPKFRSLIEKMN